jgi:hypothetical protein
VIIGCNLLKKKKKKVDGDVKNLKGWVGRNSREEVNSEPGQKESGGELLEKIKLDFVAWVTVSHKNNNQANRQKTTSEAH